MPDLRPMPATRGSGRAGGDPGNGGLRTWSGRERSSHKHRLHVPGSTSPAHPDPFARPASPQFAAEGRIPCRPRPDGARLVAPIQGTSTDSPGTDPGGYTVVARRYRPQRFEDVVGQDHVVQALRNAIRLNRVTHAYLF